jgi:NAD(P)-dependent dehydrogenase (short-subunit alcohol dehydrogenase family)
MATDPTAEPDAEYASYPSLVDRTVFVTGGADGIGAGIVTELAAQGAKVGFADVNVAKAAETVARCTTLDPRHVPRFYEVDLTDVPATQAALARAIDELGGITVLVNNAANDDRHTWDEMTPEYWDDRIAVNLRHYFFAIPAVEGITRTMARTFGPHNVRVNTVLPGWVATERQLTRWWSPEGEAGTMRDQAIKRRIYPREFAQMVLFLAADDGAACTAQHFLVDGGRR